MYLSITTTTMDLSTKSNIFDILLQTTCVDDSKMKGQLPSFMEVTTSILFYPTLKEMSQMKNMHYF